jgi:peptide/nickel transport system ATP-binding protein
MTGSDTVAQDILLDVRDLSLSLRDEQGWVQVLSDVSLSVRPHEILGVVGESGCGKSMTALSILRLLPPRTSLLGGQILFAGKDLVTASEAEMTGIRGRHISMIFQEPMSALDPVFTVGHQIAETVQRHFGLGAGEANERAVEALDSVGIASPRHVATLYPMSLSGGMRQRVMIAMALALRPQLMVMDEPTTALDVLVQREILRQISALRHKFGFSVIFITHDLPLLLEISDRIAIMRNGETVELDTAERIWTDPQDEYTKALLSSFPRLTGERGVVLR